MTCVHFRQSAILSYYSRLFIEKRLREGVSVPATVISNTLTKQLEIINKLEKKRDLEKV